jgi:hypothetical protein
MKNKILSFLSKFFLVLVTNFITTSAFSQSNNSKTLAECELVYSYAAQIFQMQNNSGAAVNLIKRSSIMTAANMMANSESDVIRSTILKKWSYYRDAIKSKIQADSNLLADEVSKCDKFVIPIALKVRESANKIWGKTFDELQHEIFIQHRSSLGL